MHFNLSRLFSQSLPVQFVQWDKLSEDEKTKARKVVAMVKQKQTEIPVVNAGFLKPGEVVSKVQKDLGNKKVMRNGKEQNLFNMMEHTRAWKKHNVRPASQSTTPSRTDKRYCVYDKAHKDYVYKEEWVNLLVEEIRGDTDYRSLWNK